MIKKRLDAFALPIGLLTIVAICFLPALSDATSRVAKGGAAADKEYVVDGHIYHDVGSAWLNITNWGLIGSCPSSPSSFSESPSLRWPGESGQDHLYAAGLWVGGIVLGERRVSTGQYETEIRATTDPADTIFTMVRGEPGGTRFPFGNPDDDGDGLKNEDPKNGLDDDGDGLIDEDYAAIGDQEFRAVMKDNTAEAQEQWPDHTPLGLQVVQRSFQWSDPRIDDFVAFDMTIRNISPLEIDDAYVGVFADFDVPAIGLGEQGDDLPGFWSDMRVAWNGRAYPVTVAYMHDTGTPLGTGYAGVLLLDHTIDPTGMTAPPAFGPRVLRHFKGQLPFDQGGDPVNDFERYEAMSGFWSPSVTDPGDYRVLLSVGPFPLLEPGAALTFRFALVVGADLEEMLDNAANAMMTYRGAALPTEPGPGGISGEEVIVRWLPPWELPPRKPVAARASLAAWPNPFNPQVEITYMLPEPGPVELSVYDLRGRLVRLLRRENASAGEGRLTWDGTAVGGRALASGTYYLKLQAAGQIVTRRVSLVR
jgi:hypothetical protein